VGARGEPIAIVLADDDADDRELTRAALAESRLANELYTVEDGEQLLDLLAHRGSYAGEAAVPRPGLILLDLNMPRMDGQEALRIIKADPKLKSIPVVILTTSRAEEEIYRAYQLGANSYVTKPVTFDGLVSVLKALGLYWFEIVELPFMKGLPRNEPVAHSSADGR
jgi:CheY-like chemotaxis protein